jgi:hypothetical protein
VQSGVAVEKGTKPVISAISALAANEHSITYERISLVKFPEKSFSTPTPVTAGPYVPTKSHENRS